MNNHQDHLHDLWRKFADKQASIQEINELFQLLQNAKNDELSQSFLRQYFAEPIAGEALGDEYWLRKLDGILHPAEPAPKAIAPIRRGHFLSRGFIRYAAAIIILFGTGAYLYTFQKKNHPAVATPTAFKSDIAKNDVLPGRQGAILTLSDGKTVVLDSLGNGIVADQAGTQVLLENGNLTYNASKAGAVSFNTMSTPKGRQFLLLLPDGTKVWLNAASSITYPTAFIGRGRTVKITGEAYFEIAKNPGQPFKVKINDAAEIDVLGTHFNVNAYANEGSIKTTLLEGSVRISASRRTQTMAPGQQAQIKQDGSITTTDASDLAQTVAWKDGVFNFDGASLKEVMNQLERWYDIDVVYEKNIPDIGFFGKISRKASLSSVLKGLADAKVNSRIEEGRRLIVTP
jgi:hypothetical protein